MKNKATSNTGQRRFAQINPVSQGATVLNLATQQMGLNTATQAAGFVTDAVSPGDMGQPKSLAPARAMGPMYLNLQSMYAIGAQYGMSQEEVKAYSDTLFHNGLMVPEQAELFSKLQDLSPQLGGNFRDVLSIVMRVAIQYRAGAPADKVNRILEVLKELSQEYQQNPNFNIVKMFADASRGDVQALPILSWIGAFNSSMKNGRSINEYYTKVNGIASDIFSPAHERLSIENKKASVAELLAQQDFLREEAMQKLIWERIHEPNFETLTKIYASWAKNPEEAFSFLGFNGLALIQTLSKNIMIAGAKIGAFTMPFNLNRQSPELKAQSDFHADREVTAADSRQILAQQTRQQIREEEINKLQDLNLKNKQEVQDEKSGVSKNKYIQPDTTQEGAQTDSFGVQSNPFTAMVQLNGNLAPLLQRLNELEYNLDFVKGYQQGLIYKSITGNMKPLQDAMVAESGMKIGGGTNELSQINSTTLLTPQMISQTVARCGKLVEQAFSEIKEYGGIIRDFVGAANQLLDKSKNNAELGALNNHLRIYEAYSKAFETELEKFKAQLIDYHTLLPTLVKVTRLEEQISMFENLSEQIKANTGNELIGQFGMTKYRTTTPEGKPTTVVGPAPSQSLIVLYMRVIVEFRNAVSKIQAVLNTGKMDRALTNSLIQRRKQIVSKIEGIKAKYTKIIAASVGSITGGAPASLEKQIRLTGRVINERTSSIDEQSADRTADAIIKKYFDDLLPGYGTILEHPDKHRNKTVKEVEEHTRKRKHKSHRHESKHE